MLNYKMVWNIAFIGVMTSSALAMDISTKPSSLSRVLSESNRPLVRKQPLIQSCVKIIPQEVKNNAACAAVAYRYVLASSLLQEKNKYECMQNIPNKQFNRLNVEQQRLLFFLMGLAHNQVFTATKEQHNHIADYPSDIKNNLKGICRVPADRWDTTQRVVKSIVFQAAIGGTLGGLLNGVARASYNNRMAQENYNALSKETYEEVFKNAVEKHYAEQYEKNAWDIIAREGCLVNFVGNFFANDAVYIATDGAHEDSIYFELGKKTMEVLNPFQAFHEVSVAKCRNMYETKIAKKTELEVTQWAENSACKAVQSLSLPYINQWFSCSGALKGAAIGAAIGAGEGVVQSILRGDFTRPLVENEIKDINNTI